MIFNSPAEVDVRLIDSNINQTVNRRAPGPGGPSAPVWPASPDHQRPSAPRRLDDTEASPDLLPEPFISSSLRASENLDPTPALMQGIGLELEWRHI